MLTADQFVGREDGLLEQQKQDSHVCRTNCTFPLILTKNQSLHPKDDEVYETENKEWNSCTLCKTLYIGETVRRLGDRFREHLCDRDPPHPPGNNAWGPPMIDDKNASKLVARPFNLPNHSKQHMAVCGLSPHQGSTESRKTLQQKFVF